MANYAPSTIARIADLNYGMRIDTAVLAASGWGGTAVWPLFNLVNGRALINQIVGEVTTVLSTHAVLLKYYFTPTGGAQIDLTADSLTASDMAEGKRFLAAGTIGGAFTFSGIGASMAQPIPYILGEDGLGGAIGIESSVAAFDAGAAKFSLWYIPLDAGVYIEAA